MRTILLLVLLGGLAYGDSITVYPSVAPNAYGSPSYTGYVSNAIYALLNGIPQYGNPYDPTYYQQQSNINPSQMIVTGFPSWLGSANPASVFGAAYASELGNRPLFGVVIQGGAGTPSISISELSFTATSNDPHGLLSYGYGQGSYNYSSDYEGVVFGTGGRPNTYITSGPNTQLVNEIVGRGSGNADAAYCTACTIAQEQAAINALYPDFAGMTQFTGTYTLSGPYDNILANGSGTFNIAAPEPYTPFLIGGGLLAIGFFRRAKRTQRRS